MGQHSADQQQDKIRKRYFSILTVSLLIVVIATITLIVVNSSKTPGAFFARSINDASYDCEDKITNLYGSNLISKDYDNMSSRYDAIKHQYIIYYRISVRTDINGIPNIKDHLAKCVVWESLGYVSDFRILKI